MRTGRAAPPQARPARTQKGREIVEVHMADNDESFAGLFRSEYDDLVRYVRRHTSSAHDAEDAATTAIEQAFRLIRKDPAQPVTRAWLRTVARRRLIDHWRRARLERTAIENLGSEIAPSRDFVDNLCDAEVTRGTLSSLPRTQRTALVVRHMHGGSVTEVSEHLDLSYKAAESLLGRSRKSFVTQYR